MVLGLRSKNRRPTSTQVDYTIHIQEIKPWPPSQSMKSLKSVVLQWAHGGRSSGSTAAVAPSPSRIEFNESFNLHVTLINESSGKGNGYQKNVLELSLYEPRRDRSVKGQLLGNAMVDLAEHGVVKDGASFGVPFSGKRSYRNTAQPVVYVKIQAMDKESSSASSSFREGLSKEESLDRDSSVSALMSEEYAEEAEIASFTDDDVSSQSSLGQGQQARHRNEAEAESANKGAPNLPTEPVPVKPEMEPMTTIPITNGTADDQHLSLPQSLSGELSADAETLDNGDTSLCISPLEKSDAPMINSSSSSANLDGGQGHHLLQEVQEKAVGFRAEENVAGNETPKPINTTEPEPSTDDKRESDSRDESDGSKSVNDAHDICVEDNVEEKQRENGWEEKMKGVENRLIEIESLVDRSPDNGSIASCETFAFDNKNEMPKPISTTEPERSTDDKRESNSRGESDGSKSVNDAHDICVEDNVEEKQRENGWEEKMEGVENHLIEIESLVDRLPDNGSIASRESLEHTPVLRHKYLQNALRRPVNSDITTSSQRLGEKGSRTLTSDRVKNMRLSMRSPPHSLGSLGSLRYASSDQYEEDVKEIGNSEDAYNGSVNSFTHNRRDDQESTTSNSGKLKHASRCNLNNVSINKVRELELKVEMLEGELREAAAIEISLYSIVAEHGSSAQKVHTPARRLSRLYIHASKQWSRERRATAARSIVSGLVLAAKACGNDVPRLTFWLSNSIVLRAIVTQAIGHSDISNNIGAVFLPVGSRLIARGKSSPLKLESLRHKKGLNNEYNDWDDLSAFRASLERIESWLFSRIIESIWWQTLTPHMQSTNEGSERKKGSSAKKSFGRKPSAGGIKYDDLSIEVWKKAFSDACEKLCPVRAEGHECGCLPMLARLAMEQCVARLDVAMFNAILRESVDEMPTDPLSDPISDPKVLPIPPGKSSFGAGAQLKNAIGNWSRWLTDLFGLDTDESLQDKNEHDDDRLDVVETFKSFQLLNALSDLLMLPKDMLLEKSIRKEVCPTFSASIIKRILGSFLPDEFCPDAIPVEVLEALDSEDPLESNEDESNKEEIGQYPCNASPIVYSPLSVASIENFIGDARSSSVLRRNGSSVVRKCHTSDDELDELDSPLASIMLEDSSSPSEQSKGNSSASVVRYQLLHDVWRNSN